MTIQLLISSSPPKQQIFRLKSYHQKALLSLQAQPLFFFFSLESRILLQPVQLAKEGRARLVAEWGRAVGSPQLPAGPLPRCWVIQHQVFTSLPAWLPCLCVGGSDALSGLLLLLLLLLLLVLLLTTSSQMPQLCVLISPWLQYHSRLTTVVIDTTYCDPRQEDMFPWHTEKRSQKQRQVMTENLGSTVTPIIWLCALQLKSVTFCTLPPSTEIWTHERMFKLQQRWESIVSHDCDVLSLYYKLLSSWM